MDNLEGSTPVWQMLPGEGHGGGGQEWTDETFYQQNRDWIPTSSTNYFDFQYVTGSTANNQSVDHAHGPSSFSAEPELGPASTYSYHHGQNLNLDDDFQGNVYGWPDLSAPTANHAPSLQPLLTSADAPKQLQDPASGSPLSSTRVAGGAWGQSPGKQATQVSRRDFSRQGTGISPPASRETSKTPASTSPTSTRRRTVAESPKISTTQARSPEPTQAALTRKRRNAARSPLARQMLEGPTPFQPNEEEEARRIHMAAFTRGGSQVSGSSTRSQGTNEPESSSKAEENLRAAESSLLESMGAGKVPGVLRAPHPEAGSSEEFALPPGKGFPIQIGSELFRLSGASIMSD